MTRGRTGRRCSRLLAAVLAGAAAAGAATPRAATAQQPLTADAGFARQPLASCPTDLRWLNQISGWQRQWPAALESRPVASAGDRARLLETWRTAPAALAAATDSLRAGLEAGRAAPAVVVRRVLEQIDGLLETPASSSPLLAPARRADDDAFDRRWHRMVAEDLEPALWRFGAFLRDEYAPRAPELPGLTTLPGGADCFAGAVEWWTTLPITPAEIEARGRERLAELEQELLDLAAPAFGATTADVLERLRAGLFPDGFDSRADVVAHAEAAIERARRAAPDWFGTTGDLAIEVTPLPRSLESSFPAGFYRPPAGSGGTAAYVVNTSRPGDRRLLSEVVAFHEAVPGHHTSFAVPAAAGAGGGAFNSGYAEGWAIYAERLADEMGLYSTTLDRIGLVAKHLWATSRLIVEPGLHVHGWSRERAVAFMLEHTPLPREEVELEVDRYAAMPGQSLAYMLGYLELRRIRGEAERRLGDRFDVRAFHDVVLSPGSRPLAEVAEDVAGWAPGGAP